MREKDLFSAYGHMWLVTMFDLPVADENNRREYTKFRKLLLAEGFSMLQFSVYARFCESRAHGETYMRHIHSAMPEAGQVRILMVTDKQFGDMKVFLGISSLSPESPPEQMLLF